MTVTDIRREYERHPCDIEIGVLNNQGEAFTAEACDFSEEGIFMVLPIASVAGLLNAGATLEQNEIITVLLPYHDQSKDTEVDCMVVHSNPIIDGRYLVGVHIENSDYSVRKTINKLIQES